MRPALCAAAVGLLCAGDPAELSPGDLVAPDLEPLDLPVNIAYRDQDPALFVNKGPGSGLVPVEAGHAGQVQAIALHLPGNCSRADDGRGFVSQSGDLRLGESPGEQVLQMVRRQSQFGEQSHVGHMPGVHIGERALVDDRCFLSSLWTGFGIAQLFYQDLTHLLPGRSGMERVQVEDAAAGAAARAAEDVLCQVDVHVLFARVGVTAGAVDVVGAAPVRRLRDTEQRDHIRHVVEFHIASFPGMARSAIPSVFLNSPVVLHIHRSSGRQT